MVAEAKIGVYSGMATLVPGSDTKFLTPTTLTTSATASFVF